MLRKVNGIEVNIDPISIRDISFPSPFPAGLEFSSPARGTWNIAHQGMLIPQAHEIFVCAASCLRGVVLTAYEMRAEKRFSTVAVEESNLIEGNMEDLIIDGVSHIIEELPQKPPCVLVYTSCVHHFCGCDLDMVYRELRSRFPKIDFTDCYMNPIMRKSGRTPDQIMRSRFYSLLKQKDILPGSVAFIGNDFSTAKDSTLYKALSSAGIKIYELTECKTYEEYQEMARAEYYIVDYPSAKVGGEDLSERLSGKLLYLPFTFTYKEIRENVRKLSEALPIVLPDFDAEEEKCEEALASLKELIKDTPVAIDYTSFTRPLGLARLLLDHGFNVRRVYADVFIGEEKEDYEYLCKKHPDLEVWPTLSPQMRFAADHQRSDYLCIGQKAAHFNGAPHFVDIVENGGLYGYQAVTKLCELMEDAFRNEKDIRERISKKAWGCESCI